MPRNKAQSDKTGRIQVSWRQTQRSVFRLYRYPDGSTKEERSDKFPSFKHKGIKIREIPRSNNESSYECDIPARIAGKRTQKRFQNREEAITYAEQAALQRINRGLDAFRLNHSQQQDAIDALKVLEGRDSLTKVAEFFIKHHAPSGGDITLGKLFNEFLVFQRSKNLRPATLRDNEGRIGHLVRTLGKDTLAKDVTQGDMEAYLKDPNWSPQTKKCHLTNAKTFFNYAVKSKYSAINPVASISLPRIEQSPPGFLNCQSIQKTPVHDLAGSSA